MNGSFDLKDKIAVVTGASSGIGRAICIELAARGVIVFGASRTAETLAETAALIQSQGEQRFFSVPTDVTAEGEVKALFAQVAKFGILDILVNNAGCGRASPLLDITADDWDTQMAINARAMFLCTREAARQMISKRQGDIINLISLAGKRPAAGFAAYTASKHAAVGFAEASSRELRKANIRVCSLCPGAVATSMRKAVAPSEDAKSITQPQHIAALIAFILLAGPSLRDLALDIF